MHSLAGRLRVHGLVRLHSTSALFTASACSMVERCPQSATMTSRDPPDSVGDFARERRRRQRIAVPTSTNVEYCFRQRPRTLAPLALYPGVETNPIPLGGARAEQITWNGVGSVELPTSTGDIRSSGRKVCPASGLARKGVTRLDTDAKRARDRAEAAFKKKEQQLREGQQAMAEYEAARAATREKTARLRALRLARDAGLKSSVPAGQKQPA